MGAYLGGVKTGGAYLDGKRYGGFFNGVEV